MNKFLKFVTVATFVLATTLFSTSAFAQGGCIQFSTPPTFQGNPNNAPKYLVALGTNASGAPVTSDHIYTDNTLATEITQGTGVTVPQQIGTPINICALPGAYTLQFNSTAGGQGYFNYNIFVPPDTTKQSASATNIVDPTDNTKRLNFTASGMTTGKTLTLAAASANTRTLTLPDPGGAATFMFINATTAQGLLASAFNIVDGTDATKKLNFTASGSTTGITDTIAVAANIAATLTLPKASSTFVGTLGTYQGTTSVPITDTNFHALIAAASDVQIPANALSVAGQRVRIHGSGVYTTAAASLLNARADLCTVSGCATGTDFAAAGCAVVTTNQANVLANGQFSIDCTFTTTSTLGATGTVMAKALVCAQLGTAATGAQSCFQDATTAVSATFDETVNEFVNISFKFSTSNAGNAAVLHEMTVELVK